MNSGLSKPANKQHNRIEFIFQLQRYFSKAHKQEDITEYSIVVCES